MRGLITDRKRANVLRREELALKGRAGMTAEEYAEWEGDPMTTVGANLLSPTIYYAETVDLKFRSDAIVVTATTSGSYLYGISFIGNARLYEGKTVTLSCDSILSSVGATPKISLYWQDGNGFEYAGGELTAAGSVTFELTENTNARNDLVAYIYATTDSGVMSGATAKFYGVMLEFGSERHEYVPYAEVVATNATKGAYNYSDLNRVERAVEEISDELGLGLITKTDWRMWDVPRASDMERYLYNVTAIRNFNGVILPLPESMERLTYSDANDIETVLATAYEATKNSPARCGEIICGDL